MYNINAGSLKSNINVCASVGIVLCLDGGRIETAARGRAETRTAFDNWRIIRFCFRSDEWR